MTDHWKRDLHEISDRARELVAEMEQVYVGPDGDRRAIQEVGEWRDIVNMAAERIVELEADARVLRCAFCGAAYPPDTPSTQHEDLTAHVKVCSAHPMRSVEAERDRLREQLRTLREAVQALPSPRLVSMGGIDSHARLDVRMEDYQRLISAAEQREAREGSDG